MTSLPEDRPRILVVDDEKVIRDMLADFLGMEGYVVRTAEDGTSALGELEKGHYDLVISDLKMPRMEGIQLLDAIGKTAPDALTVIMTGFGTVETAIDAMKRGAYDYVLKPFKLDEVVHVVQRGIEKQRMAAENLRLREALSLYKVSEAIAASLSLDQVLETVADSCVSEVRGDLVSTWLDGGEGALFERQNIRGAGVPEGASLGRLDPQKILDYLRPDAQLLEQGAGATRFFAEAPGLPLLSFVAVPLRIQQRLLGFIALASFTKGKRFDEGAAQAPQHHRLARRRRDRERPPLRGPPGHLPADDPGPGQGHRQDGSLHLGPLGSRRGLRHLPRPPPRPLPGRGGDRPAERAHARHRQDRLRAQPQQAGQAHQRRVRGLQEAPGLRARHPRPDQVLAPSSRAYTSTTSAGTGADTRSR